jgi:predicted nucleic acid-binding protein
VSFHILPFEVSAAARYPDIVLARRRDGNPIEGFDALIAAVALAAGASVATRHERLCGLRLHCDRSVDDIMSV